MIVLPPDFIMESKRKKGHMNPVYLLFDRDWGGEDSDGNGVCAFVADGEVVEVGYNDMAF